MGMGGFMGTDEDATHLLLALPLPLSALAAACLLP
jgi:hypothetical protein